MQPTAQAVGIKVEWNQAPKGQTISHDTDFGGQRPQFPVPVKVTLCGLVPSLSLSTSVPVLVPVVLGVNVTWIVQLEPVNTPPPTQLSVSAKSPVV